MEDSTSASWCAWWMDYSDYPGPVQDSFQIEGGGFPIDERERQFTLAGQLAVDAKVLSVNDEIDWNYRGDHYYGAVSSISVSGGQARITVKFKNADIPCKPYMQP